MQCKRIDNELIITVIVVLVIISSIIYLNRPSESFENFSNIPYECTQAYKDINATEMPWVAYYPPSYHAQYIPPMYRGTFYYKTY